MTDAPPASTRRDLLRTAWILGAGSTLSGIATPRLLGSGPAASAQTDDKAPTQTREAELDELHALRTQVADLQTQVAQPVVCTPAPTETPVPATATATTVPPIAIGTEVVYDADLALAAVSIAPIPASGDVVPDGQFLRVNLVARNTARAAVNLPIGDLLLVDAAGRVADVDVAASDALLEGSWAVPIGVGASEDRSVIFDVAADAGTSFILESETVPTFRVALSIESFG